MLIDDRLTPKDFNSYGARRGNDAVMTRGTFANIRLVNKFVAKAGPRTVHIPSGDEVCCQIQILQFFFYHFHYYIPNFVFSFCADGYF